MRIYETIYICPPNLNDDQMDDFSDVVREIIYDNGGKIIKQENWGRKRLAYEIQNFSEGYYFYFLYGGEKVNIDELERRLRYADECIRFLTVRLDKELKGKKHKIFTQDELRLALQMESPRSGSGKSKAKAEAEETAAGNGKPEESKPEESKPEEKAEEIAAEEKPAEEKPVEEAAPAAPAPAEEAAEDSAKESE